MAEAGGGSENPILARLKKNRTIYWLLAFLALTGAAIKWSGDAMEGSKKIIEHFFPDPQLQRDIDFDSAELGNKIANLASIPGYLSEGLSVENATLQKMLSEERSVVSARLD